MVSTRTTTPDTDPGRKTFFGQPRVLANLFGVEMWERFSFYGMQGILLIYLYYSAADGGLGIDKGVASGIVGAYGGGVYLSTILGAWLADRLIGAERTLFYSAVVVMAGHIALSLLPGLLGVGVGLVLIALGSRAASRRTRPRLSARSTTSTTSGATPDSRSSTWASTSAPSSARC